MRNAQHFYQVGELEKAKAYFIRVKTEGTQQEKIKALHFLGLSSLRNVQPQNLASTTPPEPVNKSGTESPFAEEEPAPERERAQETKDRPDRLQLSGYLQNGTAFRISKPGQLSKLRSLALLAGTGQLTESISYKVSGRAYYDAVFDLTHHYPRAVRDDEQTELSLRDTYIDYSKGSWDIRAGHQQIVWGEAVGLFYADVVNAKDLREFILPDFDFIRIPQWGTDLEYSQNNLHAELVWLPILAFNKFGRPGSEYFPAIPGPPGIPISVSSEDKPADSLKNSEIGGRLSYRSNGWDTSLFHLRTWDTFPIFKRTQDANGITLFPFHPRVTIDGFTVAKEVDDVVVKSEFVYHRPNYFLSTDPSAPDGLVTHDYFDYLLGGDYTFTGNWSTALQFSQRVIPKYDSTLFGQHRYRSYITLLLRRPGSDGRVTPELLVIKDLATHDVLARPRITVKIGSSWRWTGGLDLFGGPSDALFGEFANRNRAYSELRYDF